MTSLTFAPRFPLMVKAREALDRRAAAQIIHEDLAAGPQTGEFWEAVSRVAAQFGENAMSLEAARRYAATAPRDLDHVFFYAMVLSRSNKLEEALNEIDKLSAANRNHPAILHFRAVTATQLGDFAKAEALLHQALNISPTPVQWLALSVAKKFKPGDADISGMEAVLPRVARAPEATRAQLLYALGKAYDDIGEMDKAAAAYANGSALMRNASRIPDGKAWNTFVSRLSAGYTIENLSKLKPSGTDGRRVTFITGFPRSGTTLVEQILTSHSQMVGGAELNLIPVALMPAENISSGDKQYDREVDLAHYLEGGDFTFDDAMAYQQRSLSADPWGDVGRDYLQMVEEHFGPEGRVIDKTLNLGTFMGLILHALPNTKVFWLRRKPEDCALSNYRLYSALGSMPWTYSAKDIADFFKAEDQMYTHWTKMFPERIMTVPYEELVSDPQTWIRKILSHAGLPEEPQVFEPHKSKRAVTTASMAQVRSPISTARIGAAEAYKDFTEEFRKAYYG